LKGELPVATYYETARTNYFLVKDIEAFKTRLELITALEVKVEKMDGKDYVCLINSNENGFPFDVYDDILGEYIEIDWEGIFSEHLQDDSVAIIMGAGAEKLRYIHGYAVAFNNKGETRQIHLVDIYKIAEELGKDVKKAEY
jgi:hypothetical protein